MMTKRTLINIAMHPQIRHRFKTICDREGETMSRKIRQWILFYLAEHEHGNPQAILFPRAKDSLLKHMLDEGIEPKFPFAEARKHKIILLAKYVNDHPNVQISDCIQQFALQHGHRVDTVRGWYQLLSRQARVHHE
jgi:hypothetical protein